MNTEPLGATAVAGADPSSTAPVADPVITLSGVRKTYGTGENAVEALRGVDFAVHPGRLTAIVGPSGSGKSTLLNLLGALDTPTSGHVVFEGQDLATLSEAERTRVRARNIGFVFQFLNLLPGLTCEQNVMLGGVIVGMNPREARTRAGELLETVGLADKRRRPARKLSGGQMQRVAIARALINDPPLVLADEPTGNLDEKNAEEITALLHERASGGRAVVLVTHNMDLAEQYADELLIVRDGQISTRPRAELREMPAPTGAEAPFVAPPAPPQSPEHPTANPPTAKPPTADPPAAEPARPSMRFALDPAASSEQMIAQLAMSLASQGVPVKLRQASGGRIEIEVDGN